MGALGNEAGSRNKDLVFVDQRPNRWGRADRMERSHSARVLPAHQVSLRCCFAFEAQSFASMLLPGLASRTAGKHEKGPHS
jgi:hypothetical protein